MINCIFDPVEFLEEKKYYSQERVCSSCGKKALLNKYLKICPECSRIECDFLMKYIAQKIESAGRKPNSLRIYSPITLTQILINTKKLMKLIYKKVVFIL